MGPEETTQVSCVRTHVLGLSASLNTLDINIYIPMNKSEYSCMNTRKTRLCDDPDIDHIAIGLLSQLIHNHPILYRLITEPGTYKLIRKVPMCAPKGIAARSIAGLAI